jgi:hypothetical protein
MATIDLILEGEELSPEAIRTQELALRRLIQQNAKECEIVEATGTVQTGAKGDPITLGLLTLALKSGAAVSLINCLKGLFVREKKLKVKLKSKDGKAIEIDATNIDSETVKQLLEEFAK